MVSEAQWTPQQDEKLIILLREFPLLWDTSITGYTDRDKREKTWKLLEEEMSSDVFELRDLKARLYYYRRNYCEEHKKKLNNSFYTTSFELFNSLQFLFNQDIENTGKEPKQPSNTDRTEKANSTDYGNEDTGEEAEQSLQLENRVSLSETSDEFTIFGENIAKELQAMSKYKSIKLNFKYKVMAAILTANEALIEINKKTWVV